MFSPGRWILLDLSRSWNWNDPRFLRKQPGRCNLCWSCVFSPGDLMQKIHNRLVCFTRFLSESRDTRRSVRQGHGFLKQAFTPGDFGCVTPRSLFLPLRRTPQRWRDRSDHDKRSSGYNSDWEVEEFTFLRDAGSNRLPSAKQNGHVNCLASSPDTAIRDFGPVLGVEGPLWVTHLDLRFG